MNGWRGEGRGGKGGAGEIHLQREEAWGRFHRIKKRFDSDFTGSWEVGSWGDGWGKGAPVNEKKK